MKKLKLFAILFVSILVSTACNADENTIKLPTPNIKGGKPLMEMMDARKSYRDFSDKDIDKQVLSEVLWVAYGKNSHGTRTIPTARNQLNLKVFAVMKDGVWLYDGEAHSLKKVSDHDIRPMLAKQDYVLVSPLNLIFVGSDENSSALHAGSSYQNVSLYTESKGMANVVRGLIDREAIHKELNLAPDEKVFVSQTVGYAK